MRHAPSRANTPYDDVFRTLLTDCTPLIIPVVNEVFGEHYPSDQRVEFRPNEHFLNQQDGRQTERITDSYFVILGPEPMGYQIECQSSPDGSLVIRIFEYGVQIAVQEGELEDNVFTVRMPRSAVLYLRSRPSTPDAMKVRILTPGGEVSYDIPVIKVQSYTLEDIFARRLLFLVPFYIFTHEAHFREYERDAEKLGELQKE